MPAVDRAAPARRRGPRGRLRRRAPRDCGGHVPFARSARKALEVALRVLDEPGRAG